MRFFLNDKTLRQEKGVKMLKTRKIFVFLKFFPQFQCQKCFFLQVSLMLSLEVIEAHLECKSKHKECNLIKQAQRISEFENEDQRFLFLGRNLILQVQSPKQRSIIDLLNKVLLFHSADKVIEIVCDIAQCNLLKQDLEAETVRVHELTEIFFRSRR